MERVVASADAISVSNQFLQKKFGGLLLPHCRDTTVLDPLKFDPGQIKEKMGFKDKKVVMFLGTPRPHKGLDDLLEAFKNIDNPNLSLLIVGAENQQEFLNRVDHLIRDRVVVLPKTPFQKLPELLSVADIIAIPQRRTSDSVGQIPARLFDAMSMAKPIIATRVSDIPEVLGECGYLIDPNKPSQLANAIQYVFDHFDEALIKGRAARERCKQVYDIHNLELGLCELIEKVIDKKV
jgi:glycosyltransferase involved in cell wall biosynthesis